MSGFVWLASYPKSGNTWLRLALQSLLHGGKEACLTAADSRFAIASKRASLDWELDVESSDLTDDELEALRPDAYEAMARVAKDPLIYKVHDAWVTTSQGRPVFPPSVTLGAVYIVRDPRDVAISYAHHCGDSVDDIIDLMARPHAAISCSRRRLHTQTRQRLLSWSGHVQSWLHAPGIRLLVIRYEDMHARMEALLAEVAELCGIAADAQTLAAATAATQFHTLRAAEERSGFCEKPASAERFFRQGKAGGWRQSLTPAQARRIEQDHGEIMARLGYL